LKNRFIEAVRGALDRIFRHYADLSLRTIGVQCGFVDTLGTKTSHSRLAAVSTEIRLEALEYVRGAHNGRIQ